MTLSTDDGGGEAAMPRFASWSRALRTACEMLHRTSNRVILAVTVMDCLGDRPGGQTLLPAEAERLAAVHGLHAEVRVSGGSFAIRFSRRRAGRPGTGGEP